MRGRTAAVVATLASVCVCGFGSAAAGAERLPSKTFTEGKRMERSSGEAREMIRTADPMPAPTRRGVRRTREERSGKPLTIPPTAPKAGTVDGSAPRASQNGNWPGAYYSNPNRQIGKLYFDVQPGPAVRWSHCSGTAVNSENKSIVITAGHCAYDPDPDKNGYVNGNGRWFENFQFCPGYETNCKLGIWKAKRVTTTLSWFNGSGGRYTWVDDVAAIQVYPNGSGRYLVNALGGHGISFNSSINQYRYAFGYPAWDNRWPSYSYSGHDLIYCQGRDTYFSFGAVRIPCTMTGGASGGPWLSGINSAWMGTLNSVNSHKAWGGTTMGGPYFGQAESQLFQQVRRQS